MMMTMIVVFVLIEALDGVDYAGNWEGNEKTTNDGEFKQCQALTAKTIWNNHEHADGHYTFTFPKHEHYVQNIWQETKFSWP